MQLKRNEYDPFLKQIIAGDDKWIVYNTSIENDHNPSTMKLHEPLQRLIFTKIRLCSQFGGIGRMWYGMEMFLRNQTIKSDVYYQQLDKLNTFINKKRPELVNCKGVILHQNIARQHTSLVTRQKL